MYYSRQAALIALVTAIGSANIVDSPPTIANTTTSVANITPSVQRPTKFNPSCQPIQPTTSMTVSDVYSLVRSLPIVIAGQPHQLIGIRNFGFERLCITDLHYQNAQPLPQPELQDYIESIQPISNQTNAFIVRLRQGNGMTVPIQHLHLLIQNRDTVKITNLNVLQQFVTTPQLQPVKHTFQGKKGQSFSIDLDSRINQSAAPHLMILMPRGTTLSEGRSTKPFSNIVRTTFTLPFEGQYTVVVSNLKGRGSYMLSINANQLP